LLLATSSFNVNMRIYIGRLCTKSLWEGSLTPKRRWLTTATCGGESNRRRRRLPQKTFVQSLYSATKEPTAANVCRPFRMTRSIRRAPGQIRVAHHKALWQLTSRSTAAVTQFAS
jgi:hypothetical protein